MKKEKDKRPQHIIDEEEDNDAWDDEGSYGGKDKN